MIRPEKQSDYAEVHRVVAEAFDGEEEAELVDRLRSAGKAVIALVAEIDGEIVGHILFSSVSLSPGGEGLRLLGLAPLAVAPEHQGSGIGAALVWEGLIEAARLGFDAVVVLGHARYYPRFGFHPASRYGLKSVYNVPDDVFMAIELKSDCLNGRSGTIYYADEFGGF